MNPSHTHPHEELTARVRRRWRNKNGAGTSDAEGPRGPRPAEAPSLQVRLGDPRACLLPQESQQRMEPIPPPRPQQRKHQMRRGTPAPCIRRGICGPKVPKGRSGISHQGAEFVSAAVMLSELTGTHVYPQKRKQRNRLRLAARLGQPDPSNVKP